MSFVLRPIASILGLTRPYSYISLLRSQTFTFAVSKELLTAPSVKLINPRNHAIKTDQVYMNLPVSAITGLDDEAVLALFTRGFFGGWVFFLERWFMKLGGWRWSPPRFTGFESSKTEKIIWKCSEISKTTLLPVGDTAFGAFKLIDSHLKSSSSLATAFWTSGLAQTLLILVAATGSPYTDMNERTSLTQIFLFGRMKYRVGKRLYKSDSSTSDVTRKGM